MSKQVPDYKPFEDFMKLSEQEKVDLIRGANIPTTSGESLLGNQNIFRTWYEIYVRGYEPNQRSFYREDPKKAGKFFLEFEDREGLALIAITHRDVWQAGIPPKPKNSPRYTGCKGDADANGSWGNLVSAVEA